MVDLGKIAKQLRYLEYRRWAIRIEEDSKIEDSRIFFYGATVSMGNWELLGCLAYESSRGLTAWQQILGFITTEIVQRGLWDDWCMEVFNLKNPTNSDLLDIAIKIA